MTWGDAFLLTELLEMPVMLLWMRGGALRVGERVLVAFGTSALTHPLLWFILFPLLIPYGWTVAFLVGELLVWAVEGFYLRAFGVPRPFLLAAVANGFSAGVGWLISM